MSIRIHRKEQDDWGGIVPWVCVHRSSGDTTRRVFLLSSYGVQVGGRRWLWRRLPRHPFLVARDEAIEKLIASSAAPGGETRKP